MIGTKKVEKKRIRSLESGLLALKKSSVLECMGVNPHYYRECLIISSVLDFSPVNTPELIQERGFVIISSATAVEILKEDIARRSTGKQVSCLTTLSDRGINKICCTGTVIQHLDGVSGEVLREYHFGLERPNGFWQYVLVPRIVSSTKTVQSS